MNDSNDAYALWLPSFKDERWEWWSWNKVEFGKPLELNRGLCCGSCGSTGEAILVVAYLSLEAGEPSDPEYLAAAANHGVGAVAVVARVLNNARRAHVRRGWSKPINNKNLFGSI